MAQQIKYCISNVHLFDMSVRLHFSCQWLNVSTFNQTGKMKPVSAGTDKVVLRTCNYA